MNFNVDLWETTEPKEFGEFEVLELGGHELVIIDAEEYTSPVTDNTSLKVTVDIAGADKQKGFFKKQYDENTNADKKWPSAGVKYLSLKDEQIAYLKGFITALEKSNKSFKFDVKGNWSQIKGLKIAGQFGLEEFEKQDKTIGTTTKLVQFRSIDKLKDIKIPRVKLIDGTMVDYEEYKSNSFNRPTSSNNNDPFNDFGDAVEISDDFLD